MPRSFLPFLTALLLAPADGEGGGGGGAPGGGADGSDDDKPMKRSEIADMINKTVTGAIAGHTKRLATDLGKQIQTSIAEALKGTQQQQPGDDDGGKDKKQAPVDGSVARMQRELESLKAEAEKSRSEAAAEKRAARMEKVENQIRAALGGKLRPETVGLAVDAMKARGAIVVDDDGNATIRVPYASVKGAKPELTDFGIEDGLDVWLRTPEAAVLMPAPNAGGGSGTPPRSRVPGAGPSKESLMQKPLDKWTQEDRNAFFEQRTRELAEGNRGPLGG